MPHTADVYYEAYAPTLEEAFAQVGKAVFHTMTDLTKIDLKLEDKIEVDAEDIESLVFEFIRELLYRFDVRGILYRDFHLKISEDKNKFKLTGILKGEKFNPEKHISKTEVKAPTYAQMEIKKNEKNIIIRFVLDI